MSTEFGPTNQRYDDDGRSEQYVPDASDTSPWNESSFPNQPEYAPASAGNFFTQVSAENERQSWIDKIGRARVAIAGIAAGSVLTGVIVGIGVSGKSNERGEYIPPKEAGTSAPAVPGETSSPEASETSDGVTLETKTPYAQTLLETPEFKALSSSEQAEITTLHNMSYDEFHQLSYDRQFAYAAFYYKAYEAYGKEIVEQYPTYQKDTPEAVNKESSGQAILNTFAEKRGIIFASLATKGNLDQINDANRQDAMKALSYIYDLHNTTITKSYQNALGYLQNMTSLRNDGTDSNNGSGYPARTVERESIAGDDYGTTSKRINANMRDGSFEGQYWFTYNTYKDLDGKEDSQWQLRMILPTSNPLYIADVENAYK
ncbi:MAG TPA: hypothetical protein VJ841_04185 [Candidatus Saccharimonadales bacterium]|nr:hypothetical protein [Candidatus Saccharimonadales bacterium]